MQGDCLEKMKDLPDNSVDAIIADPPYGLGKEPDAHEMLMAWVEQGHYDHKAKRGFMGKEWDSFVPQPAVWKECFRVLKPGGHLLSFFGTRTYDIGTLAVRLAGFEIRDQINWVFGSGFPKSHNISKAMDQYFNVKREVVGRSSNGSGAQPNKLNNHATGDTGIGFADGSGKNFNITTPGSDQAKKWDGWGTALKPAHEPIVLARKPLSEKTIAKNVLKHGVGGINIGSCRVGTDPITNVKKSYLGGTGQFVDNTTKIKYTNIETNVGRFPANIIHDGSDEVLEVFPNTKSGSGNFKKLSSKEKDGNKGPAYGAESRPVGSEMVSYGDNGSASRYFYCAKTSKSDRHCTTDNNHPTVKPTALMEYLCKLITPSGGVILDPFMGSGSTGKAAVNLDFDFIGIELDPDYFKIAEKRIYAKNLDNEM